MTAAGIDFARVRVREVDVTAGLRRGWAGGVVRGIFYPGFA
jgi:hypothetical protein